MAMVVVMVVAVVERHGSRRKAAFNVRGDGGDVEIRH